MPYPTVTAGAVTSGTAIAGGTGDFTTLSTTAGLTSTANWGAQATLGKAGQSGRIDFARGDTGAPGAYVGYFSAVAGDTLDIYNPVGNVRFFAGGAEALAAGSAGGFPFLAIGSSNGEARLHIAAGQAAAGRAALKVNNGPVLTVTEAGAEEYPGLIRHYTGTDLVRRTYAFHNKIFPLEPFTVATLPAGTLGDTARVTDALAPAYGAAVAGGGAVNIPVFRNSTVWICA